MAISLPSRLLTHSASIERIREVPTQGGGAEQRYEEIASAVSCRFQQGPSPSDVNLGGIEQGEATGTVWFASTEDVLRDDRVIVEGVTLTVLGISRPTIRTAYLKAMVREAQQGATL